MSAGREIRGQSPNRHRRSRHSIRALTPNSGFVLLGLLFVVGLMGAALAAYGEFASHAAQRAKEAELLFIGHEFRQAIAAYYDGTPGLAKRYPQKLEDLLQDQRYPMVRRYLRRVYRDPMTGGHEWGTVSAPDGGIMGVYSLSGEKPVKEDGFVAADRAFAGASAYSDWKFTYTY